MTDLEIAKNNLTGHTLCLCKDGNCLYGDKRGIASMMGLIAQGRDLTGYSVADIVVGKAAAMLFVKCGIKQVYARTLSESGKGVLERHGVAYEYEALTEKIINRAGTDTCPMEKAVFYEEDVERAYLILKETLQRMAAQN